MTQTKLTARDRQSYRRRLQELTTRLSGGVAELEAEALRPGPELAAPAAGVAAHEADRAVRETEEEVARAFLVSEERLLAEATAALERLEAGTFGSCERCGCTIARARLDAAPYARTCARCARGAEGADAA